MFCEFCPWVSISMGFRESPREGVRHQTIVAIESKGKDDQKMKMKKMSEMLEHRATTIV